jgi:hypothetical protein
MNGLDVLLLVVAGFAGGIVTALAGGSVRATGDPRNRGRSPDYSPQPGTEPGLLPDAGSNPGSVPGWRWTSDRRLDRIAEELNLTACR